MMRHTRPILFPATVSNLAAFQIRGQLISQQLLCPGLSSKVNIVTRVFFAL